MFKFKQFSVKQEHSAMKVCTDACLFGSLINVQNKRRALDIGAGTGLLSLMLAQRSQSLNIDAVEIDANACIDAAQNIADSPFSEQIQLHTKAIQEFDSKEKYDLIFSNPPFYINNLKSPKEHKNTAHHCTTLQFEELVEAILRLMSSDASIWILLPPFEMGQFMNLAQSKGLHLQQYFAVRHNPNKNVFRSMVELGTKTNSEPQRHEINIYENDKYSAIFTEFLKNYYLIF